MYSSLKELNFSAKTSKRSKKRTSIKERRERNELVEVEKELKVMEEIAEKLTNKIIVNDHSPENGSDDDVKRTLGKSVYNT